jgi:ABC-2 type transport system permease protein
MNRTLLVAVREFTSTVFTRGFLLGVVLTPVFIGIAILAVALVSRLEGPRIAGRFAVVDQTGQVAPRIAERFKPEAEARAAAEQAEKAKAAVDEGLKRMNLNLPPEQAEQAKQRVTEQAKQAAKPVDFSVEVLDPASTDIDALKNEIRAAEIKTRGSGEGPKPLLALAVISPASITPDQKSAYEPFQLFVNPRLDFEIQSRLRERVGAAVVDTRLATDPRVLASGISPESLRALLQTPRPEIATLTAEGGERKSMGPLQFMVPLAFMILLMISVMTGGQYLLTAVVEEKGSRVMEVLLSAVSPVQLMVGKIMGQMAVALVILVVYSGMGIAGLIAFALADLVQPMTLVYLLVYFFIAFFTIASLMAAAGSAVNEMREAQTLISPIMMIIMLPWLLWMPIQRAPNSSFATIASFVPGVNPFVMAIRLGGSEPIPFWQIPVSMVVGIATAVFCGWAAAKIFRIGVLMYGKPPDLKTLVKWVRMA